MATIPFVKDPSSPKIYDSRTGEWIQNEQEFFNRAAQAGLPSNKFQQGVNFKVGTADEITKFGQAKPVSAPSPVQATQPTETPIAGQLVEIYYNPPAGTPNPGGWQTGRKMTAPVGGNLYNDLISQGFSPKPQVSPQSAPIQPTQTPVNAPAPLPAPQTPQTAQTTIPFVKDPNSPKIYDSRTGEWIQNEQEFFKRAAQAGLPSSSFQEGVNYRTGTADEITKFGQAKPVSAPATQVGQTPAQTQTGLPAPSLTAPSPAPIDTSKTVSDFITEQNKQSADMFTSLQKSMTDSQAALQKQQQDFMTQFGETTNKELVTKFEETQTQQKQAMQAYYDQQAKFLQDLQNQPSAVDQLKQFREQQGMPQMEAEIAKMDQAVLDVEGLLTNLSADIKKRTEGLPVTEAAARRLQAMEGAPIEKQLNELIRSRQRVAAGYEQKRAAVQEFASAAERDIARKREASGFGLQFAKEGAAFEGDLATQSFNMFSNLQDRLLKVGEAGLGFAQTSAEFSQNLAKVGFDMFSQMQSRQLTGYTADKENELAKLKVLADLNEKETQRKFELEKQEQSFQNDLILKQVENEMKNANPDYNFKTVEDEVGNVTMIQTDKKTGKSTMTNLGNIGAPSKTSGQNIPINTTELSNEQLLQAQTLSSELFGKIVGSKAENVQRITDLMKEGKNINQIRDFLKTGRFSTGFSGVMRDAAESIAINLTDKQSGAFLDSIDR